MCVNTERRKPTRSWMRSTGGRPSRLLQGILRSLTLCDRIALVPPYPGLRRFKQGRNFQQWTGNDSKALMKVRSALPITTVRLSRQLGSRCGCQRLKVLFPEMSPGASMHTLTSVTLQERAYSPSQRWIASMKLWKASGSTRRSSSASVSVIPLRLVSHSLGNTQWRTIVDTLKTLAPQTDYARLSQNRSTSPPSNAHGGAPVGTMPSTR